MKPLTFLATVLILCALGPAAAAQCILPDQLDGGPCCQRTARKLPALPSFTQDALDICWRDCDVGPVNGVIAKWNMPPSAMPLPGQARCNPIGADLELFDAAGSTLWRGRMKLQYSRTWFEVDPTGVGVQVWRFLVNGDMVPTPAAGGSPCPVPPCAAAHNGRVRYTGYLDYAFDCTAVGGFQNAWMLTHGCDLFDHQPGFPRAGVFHPDLAYTFVGPAAGFVPGPLLPTESGTSSFEAVRRVRPPVPGLTTNYTCEFEEPASHFLQPVQQVCPCSQIPSPAQYLLANLGISGQCGTAVNVSGGPFLPGFLSMGIGTWTIPGTYPGIEVVRWNAGNYDYADPCPGTIRNEFFLGATTIRGWEAFQILSTGIGAPLPLTFIDQSNTLRAGQVTILNVPYTSDHFLNLNH